MPFAESKNSMVSKAPKLVQKGIRASRLVNQDAQSERHALRLGQAAGVEF